LIAVEELARLPFFQGFSGQEISKLLSVCRHNVYKDGHVVFGEALPDDCSLFIAVHGGIRVSIAGKDHQKFVIGNAGEGTIFGEMSFVDGQPRSATITATSDLTIVSVSRQAFAGLCTSDPSVALKIMSRLAHVISMRLRNADKFVVEAKAMMAQGAAPAAPPPPPQPQKPALQMGGRVILPGGRVLDEKSIPSTFEQVEKLPEISKRSPGGLQSSDIKDTPDVFKKGDPQKKQDPG
jgi:hypothetical protein